MANVNVFVDVPKRGDIVVCNEAENYIKYIALETYDNAKVPSTLTKVGVVVRVQGNDVLIVNKANSSQKYSNVYSYKVTGFTLDGTARKGTLNLPATAAATANTAFVINYNATSLDALAEQINEVLFADSGLNAQSWRAEVHDDELHLVVFFSASQQRSASGSAGFTLAANLFPWLIANSNSGIRKNGQRAGEGAISNLARALVYFRNDNSNTAYNPNADVTSIKRGYPICLPAYLGTSQYQSDHCAFLRSVYGEGEEGWRKFMESCVPIYPQKYGMWEDQYKDGLAITKQMDSYGLWRKNDGSEVPYAPLAHYCQGIGYNCDGIRVGDWGAPSVHELRDVVAELQYNTTNNREADVLNKALYKMGGSAISNGSYTWSVGRHFAINGWFSSGGLGFFSYYFMFISYLALPLAHLKINA